MQAEAQNELKVESFCRTCGKQIPPLPVEDAFCVSCRYDTSGKPAAIHAPSEDEIALASLPAPAEADDLPEERRFSSADALHYVLKFLLTKLTSDATPLQVGQRAIALAYLADMTEAKTNRELAVLLKVTPGRVTQILQAIPTEFQSLLRLKSRTAKGRVISGQK
jgi:hypothetical protein